MQYGPGDRQFLKSLHVAVDTEPDPHAECHRRWLEERTKREAAEQRAIDQIEFNAQEYSDKLAGWEDRISQYRRERNWALLVAVLANVLYWWR